MDRFKVLSCLFGPVISRYVWARLSVDRTVACPEWSQWREHRPKVVIRNKRPRCLLQKPLVRSWARRNMMRLIAAFAGLAVPIFLAGCGGGPSNPLAYPSSSTAGTSGSSGMSGTSGTSGSSGTTGTSDSSSTSGTSGTSSTSATNGSSGTTGTTTGGTSGTSQTSGTSATSGSSGTTETAGTGGTSGTSGTGSTSGTVGGSGTVGTVISDIQTASGNWKSWGQGAPNYVDCSPSPCNGYAWSMQYGITLPSLSNDATQFIIDGTKSYGDALFSAQLMGTNSPQLRDADHTLLPTLNNFIYDVDFYVTDASITQVLEFDISMYMNGIGMIWGTQCNYLGDKDWDIWDNANKHWVSAGIPCNFVNGWNHLTIHAQRESDNTLLYQSIELDGTTYTLDKTYPPGTADSTWWGVTVNYQMDGDSKPDANTTYLDNFSLTYW